MHKARGARRRVRTLPSARVDERAAMREAGRAARTERTQAAKRGLSWSGGEGDGDARDEHDECGGHVTSTRTVTPSHKACTDVRSVPA